MAVDSVSEHAVMIIRRAVGWSAAAWKHRCDGGMITEREYRATRVIAPYERNLIISQLSMPR
jgi:hypothetical protein